MGYIDVHKGYFCYDPNTQRVRVSSTVVFFEHLRFFEPESSPTSVFPLYGSLPMFSDDESADDLDAYIPPDVFGSLGPSNSSTGTDTSSTSANSSGAHSSGANSTPSTVAGPSSPIQSPPLRRSLRANKGVPPAHFDNFVAHGVHGFIVPTRYRDAQGDPVWEAAMGNEFDALHANDTWDVVDRPAPDTQL
ncbi:unnamed protein product [Linum trigynum]|uniref:Retroviral polymerase SH3-like domain-containing protein n=1 Tax=Linum trigynum TaxID=586398 RepID=A0AAV2G0I2_9ROSI